MEFGFTNQIDKNIFHCLTNLILEGPTGILQFKSIFKAIKDDPKLDVKAMLNTVDYNGFTPILSYVRSFSSGKPFYSKIKIIIAFFQVHKVIGKKYTSVYTRKYLKRKGESKKRVKQ